MGSTSSAPVAADSGAGVAIVTQTPSAGCPVQHSTPVPSVSECPAHQGGSVKLQASQCPISRGAGCDSAALDNSSDALDPSNMVIFFCTLWLLIWLPWHVEKKYW